MQEENEKIKARIAELKARYAKLCTICSFGARVSPQTIEAYAQEIEALQTQLN